MADGTIIIDIIARTDGVEQGVNKATGAIDKLNKSTDAATTSSEEFQRQLNKTEGAAEDAGDEIRGLQKETDSLGKKTKTATTDEQGLEEALKKEGDAAEQAGSKSRSAADKIQETGNKSKKASSDVLGLRDAANKLKSAFSILAIGGVLIKVTDQMLKVQQATADAAREFETLYGNAETAAQKLGQSMDATDKLVGGKDEQKKSVAQAGNREFESLSAQQRRDIEQKALDIGLSTGIDGGQFIYKIGEIIDKYDLEQSDAVSVMKQILEVAEEMHGDIGENIQSVTGTVAEYDYLAKAEGWDYTRMLQNVQALGADRKDPSESMAIVARQYQQQQTNLINAQKELPKYEASLKKLEDEKNDLYVKLSQAESEDRSSINDEIVTVEEEIKSTTEIIKELKETVSKTPGELARELFSGNTLSEIAGSDKIEAQSVLSIIGSAPKTTSISEQDNYVKEPEKTTLEKFGTAWSQFWTNAGVVMAEDSTTKSLVDQKKAAREELNDYISILRKAGYEDLVKKYEGATKPGIALTNPELSLDELTSAIREAKDELARLGLKGSGSAETKQKSSKDTESADYEKAGTSLGNFAGTAETATEKTREIDEAIGDATGTVDDFADSTDNAEGTQGDFYDTQETTTESSGLFRDTLAEVNTNLLGLSTESTNAANTLATVFDVQIGASITMLNRMADALRTVIALQRQVK